MANTATATSSTSAKLVPVSEMDYLDEDKPIRNQNFVCLSFISPEDVILDKEVVFFSKYISAFSNEMNTLLSGLAEKYPNDASMIDVLRENSAHIFDPKELQEQYKFFKSVNGPVLESEYHEKCEFRTSMRGIKVRGVYDTLREAQVRAEVLKKMGDKFSIFVAAVGCWCPWSPNPEDLENQEYAESQLNTLMGKYKENVSNRDLVFEQRKEDKIKKAKEEAERITANNLLGDELESNQSATELLEDASKPIEVSSHNIEVTDTPVP
jgi:hypothetical protein